MRRSWQRASWWLGAAAGIALALYGAATEGEPPLPADAIAVVDGVPISADDYQRALRALASDGAPLDAAARQRVLDRLIEEQLLVARGVELGLMARDRQLRAGLSAAVIELLVAKSRAEIPDEAELERFHAAHRDRFVRGAQVDLEVRWVVRQPGEADEALMRRALTAIDAPERRLGMPRGWLHDGTLRTYLGGDVADRVAALEVDAVSALVRPEGALRLTLLGRRGGKPLPYAAVRDQVRFAYQRQLGNERLRAFLDARRAAADIVVDEERL